MNGRFDRKNRKYPAKILLCKPIDVNFKSSLVAPCCNLFYIYIYLAGHDDKNVAYNHNTGFPDGRIY